MIELRSLTELEHKIQEDKWVLLYLSRPECNVCKSLLPKIKKMVMNYPKLKAYYINLNNDESISGQLSIFNIPALIVYTNKKETIREARYISIKNINEKLERINKYI